MMFVQLQLEQTKEKRRSQKRSHRTMLAEAVSQPKMTKPNQTAVSSLADDNSSSSSLRHAHSRPSTSKGAQTSASPNPAVPSSSRASTKPPSFPSQSQLQSRLPTTPSSSNLSDHAANASSSRSYARDLSRLRLMCPSHQPCVVYSNRELATEIKSIVSATKKAPNEPKCASDRGMV